MEQESGRSGPHTRSEAVMEQENRVSLCHSGWNAVVQSWLTTTSASGFKRFSCLSLSTRKVTHSPLIYIATCWDFSYRQSTKAVLQEAEKSREMWLRFQEARRAYGRRDKNWSLVS
ncbi:hypothetical protein AAY473_011279 [Plecturocebus cupreus]